jgi:hypothetical protein
MAFKRASPEEKAARDQEKASREEQKAREREAAARKRMREDFFTSPAGQARIAYETGAHVFQYSLDVHKTQAVVVNMVGAYARTASTTDPSVILNSVCNEGWDLVNGSFVFLELGSESRDKFLASGQQVAVKGSIVGYYLFRRCERNKKQTPDPWEVPSLPEVPLPNLSGATAAREDDTAAAHVGHRLPDAPAAPSFGQSRPK